MKNSDLDFDDVVLKLLAGLGFFLFFGFAFFAMWVGMRSGATASSAGGRGAPAPVASRAPVPATPPRPAPGSVFAPTGGGEIQSGTSGVRRVEGDLLSDLMAAVEEGEDSGLVHLETEEMQLLFDRWRWLLLESRALKRETVTIFLLAREEDGLERYELVVDGTGIRGVIAIARIESRWHLLGVWASRERMERNAERHESLRLVRLMEERRQRAAQAEEAAPPEPPASPEAEEKPPMEVEVLEAQELDREVLGPPDDAGAEGEAPPGQGIWVLALKVRVTSSRQNLTLLVGPGSFRLEMGGGKQLQPARQKKVEPSLSHSYLESGDSVEGWLTFLVPRGATRLVLAADLRTPPLRIPVEVRDK